MTTYRTLPLGEVIPPNAEYRTRAGDWRQTQDSGSKHTTYMDYRVPINDEPPPPPTDERVAVIGDTRYMKEEGQWYRLLDIGELIPQDAEFLNGSERWWRTDRRGEKVFDPRVEYRVPCDPPHGTFGKFLKQLPVTFTPLPEVVWQDMCMKAHKERDQLHVQYQSLKAEHLKALEVIENIRDALTAKDA